MPWTITIPDDVGLSLLDELAALKKQLSEDHKISSQAVCLPRGLAAVEQAILAEYPSARISISEPTPLLAFASSNSIPMDATSLDASNLNAPYIGSPPDHPASKNSAPQSRDLTTPLTTPLPSARPAHEFTEGRLFAGPSVLGKRSSGQINDSDSPTIHSPSQVTSEEPKLPESGASEDSPPVPIPEPPTKRQRVTLLFRSRDTKLWRPDESGLSSVVEGASNLAADGSASSTPLSSESDSSDTESVSSTEARKKPPRRPNGNRRNGNGPRIGTDADIGRMGRGEVDEGESEVDNPERPPPSGKGKRGVPGKKGKMKEWRSDGTGPDVTKGAGLLLNTLITIFAAENQERLRDLLQRLRDPSSLGAEVLSSGTDMDAVIGRLKSYETQRQVLDFVQMCDLIQLALNVDNLRKEAVEAGNKPPGIRKIAKRYSKKKSTFYEWATAGFRLLHMCSAATFYILPILACLDLRSHLTKAPAKSDIVRDINSLSNALREVSDAKWGLLIKRFMVPIKYIQEQKIPLLETYKFVRGQETFGFSDVAEADRILDSVATGLYHLPARSSKWTLSPEELFVPPPEVPLLNRDDVINIQTPLVLPRTSTCPFKKNNGKAWTEAQRELASNAEVVQTPGELSRKLIENHRTGTNAPGKYLKINSDILNGNALTIRDSTGLMVSTLIPMPKALTDRFQKAILNLDAILPGEFKADNSRREGYEYLSLRYVWYWRMGERVTIGFPIFYFGFLIVNWNQRMPYASVESLEHSLEYEALIEVFGEVMEFQRANFEHLLPDEYSTVSVFADVLPLNVFAPAYPFSGFALNLRVATDGHRDPLDKDYCLIIIISECEGGELCLYELGLVAGLKTGDVFIFPSCYVTHFNLHFNGLRATLVLHTDRQGDQWAKNGGGWGKRVAHHYARE
ncbi:hypothetical protein B0H11DRAFT_2423821 [Mycena galericulata]|nr:hypothetical protein B0H11DRAFT_2423821 [Mycena galericulata]